MLIRRLNLLVVFVLFGQVLAAQTQAIEQARHALATAVEPIEKVKLLNRLGVLFRTVHVDSCFYYGLEARNLAAEIGDVDGQAKANVTVANSLYKRGLYAESLELLGNVIPYFEKSKNHEDLIRVYLDKVEVLAKEISDEEEREHLLQKAIRLGKQLKKDSILAEVYLNYVSRHPYMPEDSLRYYLDAAEEIATRYDNSSMLLYKKMWDARILYLSGKKKEAKPMVLTLIQEAKVINNPTIEINGHFVMVGYGESDPDLGRLHYDLAFQAAKNSGNNSLEVYILKNALDFEKDYGDSMHLMLIYDKLFLSMEADWVKSKKFVGDYVHYQNIQLENASLNVKNKQRARLLIFLSIGSILIVITILYVMYRRNKKAKFQIKALNEAVNLQIVILEDEKQQAVRAEQQRLGQDLHDNLASSIVAIQHQLELLAMTVDDVDLERKLLGLQQQAYQAYEVARSKSHDWYTASEEKFERSFEYQIRELTNRALPDREYLKDIYIDDLSLNQVSTDTRIAVLRIIQEAITNIIKHAKAKNVSILVYDEMDHLIVSVKDDGRGFDEPYFEPKKSKLGLQSIRTRVQNLQGEFKVNSNHTGTEILVSLPF